MILLKVDIRVSFKMMFSLVNMQHATEIEHLVKNQRTVVFHTFISYPAKYIRV